MYVNLISPFGRICSRLLKKPLFNISLLFPTLFMHFLKGKLFIPLGTFFAVSYFLVLTLKTTQSCSIKYFNFWRQNSNIFTLEITDLFIVQDTLRKSTQIQTDTFEKVSRYIYFLKNIQIQILLRYSEKKVSKYKLLFEKSMQIQITFRKKYLD